MRAVILALFLTISTNVFAADTWTPRKVYPNLGRCGSWAEVKKVLEGLGETIRATYRDEDGNDWLLFVSHKTGSWSVLVMPPHMRGFGGLCVHAERRFGFTKSLRL